MFPDLQTTIDEVLTVGDRVAVWWTARGTQQGALKQGIPPTGKVISWTGVSLYTISGGRILREKIVEDFLTLLREAGTVQDTPKA